MEETVTIATPDHVDLEFDLAGLGSRFAAYVIDMLCLSALALMLIIVAIVGLGLGNLGALLRAAPGGEQWVAPWAIAIVTQDPYPQSFLPPQAQPVVKPPDRQVPGQQWPQ